MSRAQHCPAQALAAPGVRLRSRDPAARSLLRVVPGVPTQGQTPHGATAHRTCQWIRGRSGLAATKCGRASVVGCSWCEEHRAIVFVTDMRIASAEEG